MLIYRTPRNTPCRLGFFKDIVYPSLWSCVLCLVICLTSNSTLAQCNTTVDIPSNINLCEAGTVDVNATITGDYESVEWTSNHGFSSNNAENQNITVDQNTTFTVKVRNVEGSNYVVNGDFEAGDVGFTTNYIHISGCPTNLQLCEGAYTIDDNPNDPHSGFCNGEDHTPAPGTLMLIANGKNSPDNVWCQNITVPTNTDFKFNAWALNAVTASPAKLQFKINGTLIGNVFTLGSATCIWEEFNAEWNSGANTTAEICISNENTTGGGNDFALDDISFYRVCETEKSFDVTISSFDHTLNPPYEIDCDYRTVDIEAYTSGSNYSYHWDTDFGTIDGAADGAVITASAPGNYYLTVTDVFGCTDTLQTKVTGSTDIVDADMDNDMLHIPCDQNEVFAIVNSSEVLDYNWSGDASNTGNIAIYDIPGTYTVTVTNQYNCSAELDFTVTQATTTGNYTLNPPAPIQCLGDSTTIEIISMDNPTSVSWTNDQNVNLGNDSSFKVDKIGFYYVSILYPNGCILKDTVEVISQVSSLTYKVKDVDTLNCTNSNIEIGVDISSAYKAVKWYSGNQLIGNTASTQVDTAGLYTLEIEDPSGCISQDLVQVKIDTVTAKYNFKTKDIDCSSGKGDLWAYSLKDVDFQWTLPDDSKIQSDTIQSTQAGIHLLEVINPNGCIDSSYVNLQSSQDYPVVSYTTEIIDCAKDSITISATSSIPGTDFKWTTPKGEIIEAATFKTNQAGIFSYTATTKKNCISEDKLEVEIDTAKAILSLDVLDTLNCAITSSIIEVAADTSYELLKIDGLQTIVIDSSQLQSSAEGWVQVEIKTKNHCVTKESIYVPANYTLPPEIDIAPFELNCAISDSLIQLDKVDSVHYTWSFDNQSIENHELLIVDAGSYNILSTHQASNCTQTHTFDVSQDINIPDFMIDANIITCAQPKATITLDIAEDYTKIDAAQGAILKTDKTYEVQADGTYEFTVHYANGCIKTKTIEVLEDVESPIISGKNIVLACDDRQKSLFVNHQLNNPTISWTGPGNITGSQSNLAVNQPGTYKVVVTNNDNGCSSELSLEALANMSDISVDYKVQQPLCYGDLGTVEQISATGGTEPYDYSILDMQGVNQNTTSLIAGEYTLQTLDAEGCQHDVQFNIVAPEMDYLELGADTTINLGTFAALNFSSNLSEDQFKSITWEPTDLVDCADCYETTTTLLEQDQWFVVYAISEDNCPIQDSILVRVLADTRVFIPNTFTPNGDGNNDDFLPFGNSYTGQSKVLRFNIYDRWGECVHQKQDFILSDRSYAWKGLFKNKAAMNGIYTFLIQFELPSGEKESAYGTVLLTR